MVLSGKVVLITGGAGSIGKCIVEKLLTNNIKGIAILDKTKESGDLLIEEMRIKCGKNNAIFIQTDITKEEEFDRAFEITIKKFNQLDIVINNAGIVDESNWEQTIAVNTVAVIRGTFLATKKYLPKYKSGNEGIVLNIASQLGCYTIPFIPVYCASKHAVVGLGKALGHEDFYESSRCKILTICPGPVNTPLITDVDDKRFYFSEKFRDELKMYHEQDYMLMPKNVAEGLVQVLKKGENGSIWFLDNNIEPYQVEMPDVEKIKKKVNQFS